MENKHNLTNIENNTIIDKLRSQNNQVVATTIKKILTDIDPFIYQYILKSGGNREDSREIIHDAIFIFLRKIKDNNFIINTSINLYVIGVCKALWRKEISKRSKISILKDSQIDRKLNNDEYESSNFLDDTIKNEQEEVLYKVLKNSINELLPIYQEILIRYFFDGKGIKEIASEMDITEINARQRLSRSRYKLRKIMNTKLSEHRENK